MIKICHLADIHAHDKNLAEVIKCLEFILKTVKEEVPDIAIIAGDIYDSRDIQLDTETCKYMFDFIHRLSEITPIAIVKGTPSHEGSAMETLRYASAFEHNVMVSTEPEQLTLKEGQLYHQKMPDPTAIISMMPTPTKQWMQGTDDEVSRAITPIFAGFGASASEFDCPHTLVYHGTFRGAAISETQVMVGRDIEITKEQLNLGNFDLGCFGHIHLPQELKMIDFPAFYSGSVPTLNYGETYNHGFYIHDLGKNSPSSISKFGEYASQHHFIETPSRKLKSIKINETSETPDIFNLDEQDIEGATVKLEFTCWQDEAANIAVENIKTEALEMGAKEITVNIIRMPRENVRSEKILKLDGLRDKITEMGRLKNEEVPEDILVIADKLETMTPDEILAEAANEQYTARPSSGIPVS